MKPKEDRQVMPLVVRATYCVLLASVAVGVVPAKTAEREPTEAQRKIDELRWEILRDWPKSRDRYWETVLREAGKLKGGLQLSVRPMHGKPGSEERLELFFQVKNVGDRPVAFFQSKYGDMPAVWIRDHRGSPAEMTKEGIEYYRGGVGGGGTYDLKPGYTWGAMYDLKKHFALESGNTYTLLAAVKEPGPGFELVASPLKLELQKPGAAPKWESAGVGSKPPPGKVPKTPGDKEWEELSAKAGRPIMGCVLEAEMSPVSPGKLVVSLCHEDLDTTGARVDPTTRGIYIPEIGYMATDYRVLVRDPAGKPVPLTRVSKEPPAKEESHRKTPEPYTKMTRHLRFGDGVGALIPLKEWFDMQKPGEYSVLVSLPSSDPSGPVWVAKPIKVTMTK
jgi:hypothetical protein